MNDVTAYGDKRMTVWEVAEQLGCNPETVKGHIRELWPGLMQNGVTTYLNETQVTVILEKMKVANRHYDSSGRNPTYNNIVVGIETTRSRTARVVMQLKVIDAAHRAIEAELEAEIAELKAENHGLKAKAETDRPKVEFFDQVADSKDAISMRDVAGVLNIPGWGRNRIFRFLRDEGVLDDLNIPYREYQDRGYFRVIEQKWTDNEGETHISLKTLVYQRGVDFIRKLIGEAA